MVSCPVPTHGKGTGDRTPSLLIADSEYGLKVRCFAGCASKDVISALNRMGLSAGWYHSQTVSTVWKNKDTTAAGLKLWSEGRGLEGTPAGAYLRARGFPLEPELSWVARSHRSLWYHEERRCVPGMLTLLRDIVTGEPCGVIRTFIDTQYLRPNFVYDPRCKLGRKTLGRMKNAAIKLGGNAEVLAAGRLVIGEGFETVAAAWLMDIKPAWALGSAMGVIAFPLIQQLDTLIILTERDEVGERSARICGARWNRASKSVYYSYSATGKDHADMLCNTL